VGASLPGLYLGVYRGFYWLGHGQSLFASNFHAMNLLSVNLDMFYKLVVRVSAQHETAIAVYFFRQVSSFPQLSTFLIN